MAFVSDFFSDFPSTLEIASSNARTSWEVQFIGSLRQKYFEWGDKMFLSDKQVAVIAKLL